MKRFLVIAFILLFAATSYAGTLQKKQAQVLAKKNAVASFDPVTVYCNGSDGVFEATDSIATNYVVTCLVTVPTGGTSITKLSVNITNKGSATDGYLALYNGSVGGSLLSSCDFTPADSLVECSISQAVSPGNYYLALAANSALNGVVSDENSGNSSYFASAWSGDPVATIPALTTNTGKIFDMRAYVE